MRLDSAPAFLVGMIATVRFVPAIAAEFYRVASEFSYDLPQSVSPDGSTVVTTVHVWTPAGGLVPYLPGNYTYSRDISNNGIVVGLVDGSYVAFRTPVGGPIEELSGNYSDAYGITPDGSVIVGYSTTADGYEAVRWTRQTGLVGLGHMTPGNHFGDAAHAVSADGSIVVGEAESAQGQQAFRWTQPTGLVGIGDLPGGDFSSAALGISSDGQVIIGRSTSSAGTEAFRWTQATGMVGLGDLPGGTFYSEAYNATADGGIVVGESRTTLIDGDAFIWTAADGMRSLQAVLTNEYGLGPSMVGWRLSAASDISDDGNVIVGYGRAPSGNLEGFVVVIPEPSTAALVIAAIVLILIARQRAARLHRCVLSS